MEFQEGREQVSSVHAASIHSCRHLPSSSTGLRPAEVSPNPEILEDSRRPGDATASRPVSESAEGATSRVSVSALPHCLHHRC